MDTTPTVPPTTPPVLQTPTPLKGKKPVVLFSVIALVVVVIIAVAGYFLYQNYFKSFFDHTNSVSLSSYNVFLASNAAPLSALEQINTTSGAIAPVTLPAAGTAVVLDEADDASSSAAFFIIADPNDTTSNIYKENLKNPSAGLQQITHDSTLKYDLALDPISGTVAYVSPEAKIPHVFVVSTINNSSNTAPKDLGPGTHPVLMPLGFFVVIQQSGNIYAVNVSTGKEYQLLSDVNEAPYAIDSNAKKIALYNPLIHSIQYFSFATLTSASYTSTQKISFVPNALTYENGTLIAATSNALLTSEGSTFSSVLTTKASLPQINYKLLLQHD